MKLSLQKVHGSGNDFFILDERTLIDWDEEKMQALRQAIIGRKNGLLKGADGLLLVSEGRIGTAGQMRVINSDGSEASMCGNGLRTVARYLKEHDRLEGNFTVQTMYADLAVGQDSDFADGVESYRVQISPVSFAAESMKLNWEGELINQKLPALSETLRFTAVSVPNPHLIAFVDHETLQSDELVRIASYLNSENPYFADGVNVTFVEILEELRIATRTYERGVGLTNACGTAMSASSLVYVLLYQPDAFEEKIDVFNPGGMVKTIVHQNGENYAIELIGNATLTHEIIGEYEDFVQGNWDQLEIIETQEQVAYESFINTLNRDGD